MNAPIVILGIDPGLQRCGWGVVVSEGSRLSHIAHGVITPCKTGTLAERLAELFGAVGDVIAAYAPQQAAIEETYVNSNARAALSLGQARGVTMAACARAGLSVGEYSPTTIKKALVGTGGAEKDQVAFMVRRLLPMAGAVSADAADALATALCHAAHGAYRRKAGA